MSSAISGKRETLNIRIRSKGRRLIDRATRMCGKNPADFILDAARLVAEEMQLDPERTSASPETHVDFLARFDASPALNGHPRKTIQEPAPWVSKACRCQCQCS